MKGKKSIAKTLKEYIIITIGLLCYVGSWVIFILPNELVGGGVSGIGAIIQYSTGFPVSYSFFIINTILLLIALKVLGKGRKSPVPFGPSIAIAAIIVYFYGEQLMAIYMNML